jgi:hypothetical protein
MGLPVMGDKAPRFCGPAAGPGAGAGRGVPAAPGSGRAGALPAGAGPVGRARATGVAGGAGGAGAGVVLATEAGAGAEATAGPSRRTWAGAGVADGPTGAGGRTAGPAGACEGAEAATTPGGGGTRRWLEELTTGEGPAGAAVLGAPMPAAAATLSALDGAVEVVVAVVAGRVPADTVWGWAAGNTPAGGKVDVLAAATPRPATASACRPAGTVAAGLPARDEVSVCTGADKERPETGAGRSCSGAGSSG